MQLLLKYDKPTCQDYHEKKFDENDFNWKLIYRRPCFATYETKIYFFEYKLLYDVLYLNKKLFRFGIISQSKSSFCELHGETQQHFFFINALMHKIYGTNFGYIGQKKLHYSLNSTECHLWL